MKSKAAVEASAIVGSMLHGTPDDRLCFPLVTLANSWGVITATRASALASETLVVLDGAITEIAPPEGVSDVLIEHLQWIVRRLLAGEEISEPMPSPGPEGAERGNQINIGELERRRAPRFIPQNIPHTDPTVHDRTDQGRRKVQ